MEFEQDGVELETVNTENEETVVLPVVEDEEIEETETTKPSTEIDDEKESLKRAINAERSERKKLEKELKRLKEEANKPKEKTTFETLSDGGIDEEVARTLADVIDKKKPNNSNLENELADLKFESSIAKKSKEEGFEDIANYSDEIRELYDKGLTLEQSYYAVAFSKPKTKDTKSEIERKVEARLQNNQARKEILGNYNNNIGSNTNSKGRTNLSSEEIAIASMSGLSPEEYEAIKKMDNVADYNKYNDRKKK